MPSRRLKKILHIDDDEQTLHTVGNYLVTQGYEVASSTSPFVSSLIERERPDLIIMDIGMPFLSGEKIVRIIRSQPEYASLPILLFSGQDSERIRSVAAEAGGIPYVEKKAGLEALRRKVARLFK